MLMFGRNQHNTVIILQLKIDKEKYLIHLKFIMHGMRLK